MTPSSAALLARRPRRGSAALAGAVAAVLLVAAACSSSGESDSSDGGSSGGSEAAMADGASEAAADKAEAGAAAGAATRNASAAPEQAADASLDITTDALVGRDIIRTGSLTVLTDDLTSARAEVAGVVVRLGGVVASETTVLARGARDRYDDGNDAGDQSMQLSLQVPTARFDAAMTAIAEVGRVQARSINSQDVTAQVADVDSRVESARAALVRVRALLARANSLGTVISLEGVLSDRQADLEALLAQQRALQGQTQLATITLDLRVAADAPLATQEANGFVAGLRTGWNAFTGVLVGSATVLGMLVPFAVLVAPIAAAALVWRRRRSGQLSPPAT